MAAKIPATIVTGFLGSGKTTLIRHLIERVGPAKRLALVVNEFGSLGLDGELLKSCGVPGCDADSVVELANGCICCTVADDFLPTMQALLAREPKPEHIVIETSGLALPKPLVQAFAWPEVKAEVTVDGVVAVVDAAAVAAGTFASQPGAVEAARQADPALDHERELAELFADQVSCADLVALTKTDLVDAAGRAKAEAAVDARARPGTARLAADHGRLDPALVLGHGAAAEADLETRPSQHEAHHHDHGDHDHNHGHDAFTSFVLALGEVADPDALRRALAAALASQPIYRVKGALAVSGKPMRLILQAVGPRVQSYYDRRWAELDQEPASRLVVIADRSVTAEGLRAELGLAPVAA